MRLNGWQRIGIILSTVWIMGVFYNEFTHYGRKKVYSESIHDWVETDSIKDWVDVPINQPPTKPLKLVTDPTILAQLNDKTIPSEAPPAKPSAKPDLSKYSDAELEAMLATNPDNPANLAMKAVRNSLPVPLTWFVIYLIIWIFRWVKAGFQDKKKNIV